MMGHTRRFAPATLTAILCLAVAAASAPGSGGFPGGSPVAAHEQGPVTTIESSGVIEVEACCQPGRAFENGLPPAPRDEYRSPPEGRVVDEETWLALKAHAEVDEKAPIGREIGFEGEPDPDEGPDAPVPVSSAPRLHTSFDGIDQLVGRGFPPDTQVAVGPDHVLEAVNFALRLSSHDNRNVEVQSLVAHWDQRRSAFLFDPRVHYDPMSQRFFILVTEFDVDAQKSRAYLSVSRGPSPAGIAIGWCNYSFNTKRGKSWADFPGIGMNEKWLAINVNNFKFAGGFQGSYVYAADKTDLVDNAASCPKLKVSRFALKRDAGRAGVFNPQAAQHHTESGLPGNPLFLLNTRYDNTNVYALWRIRSKDARAEADKPKLEVVNVAGTGFTFPPDALQKKGGVRLNTTDLRIAQQVVYRDGKLWAAHATGCRIRNENLSCIRVLRIVPTEAGGAIDFEDTFGVRKQFLWMPGIAVNGRGQAVTVFQRSGSKVFMSTGYSGLRSAVTAPGEATGAAEAFDNARFLQKGTCNAQHIDNVGRARTGDYTGAMVDPVDDRSFWLAAEYATKMFSECVWSTRIGKVSY